MLNEPIIHMTHPFKKKLCFDARIKLFPQYLYLWIGMECSFRHKSSEMTINATIILRLTDTILIS